MNLFDVLMGGGGGAAVQNNPERLDLGLGAAAGKVAKSNPDKLEQLMPGVGAWPSLLPRAAENRRLMEDVGQKFAAETGPARGGYGYSPQEIYTPARRWSGPGVSVPRTGGVNQNNAPQNYGPRNYGPPSREEKYGVSPAPGQSRGKFLPSFAIPSYDFENPQENAVPTELQAAASELNEAAPPGERLAFVNPLEEAGLRAAGGQGQPAAGGIPSYKKGDVEAPPDRDYYDEMTGTLTAQADLAPWLYELERTFRPGYADLERRMQLENFGLDPDMGLLEAYETGIAPSIARQKAQAAQTDIDALRRLGPQLLEAQRAVDPVAENLRQSILAQATEGLEAGGGLTAQEQRDTNERINAMAAERGLVGQNVTDYNRMAALLTGDRGVRQQRLGNAASAYGLGAMDPLMAITGRQAGIPGQVGQQFGTGSFALQASPAIFNPESAYSGALNTQNWQGEMDARMATAANRSGMFTGLLTGGANIAAAYAPG